MNSDNKQPLNSFSQENLKESSASQVLENSNQVQQTSTADSTNDSDDNDYNASPASTNTMPRVNHLVSDDSSSDNNEEDNVNLLSKQQQHRHDSDDDDDDDNDDVPASLIVDTDDNPPSLLPNPSSPRFFSNRNAPDLANSKRSYAYRQTVKPSFSKSRNVLFDESSNVRPSLPSSKRYKHHQSLQANYLNASNYQIQPPTSKFLPLPITTPQKPQHSHGKSARRNSATATAVAAAGMVSKAMNSVFRHDNNNKSNNDKNGLSTSPSSESTQYIPVGPKINLSLIDPKERALWKWSNVEHLDNFLREIYDYYLGNGFYCILLSRCLNMLTVIFVVGFSTYLTRCIDYSKLRTSSKLEQVQYPNCASTRLGPGTTVLLWVFFMFWIVKVIQYIHDIKRLVDLKNFYFYLLNISEAEMQTISWQLVVKRLMLLRDKNPQLMTSGKHKQSKDVYKFLGSQSKQKMGPHDVANRIMRKENYMIAMINKNILNLNLPVPNIPVINKFVKRLSFMERPFLTRTIEWNLSLCIMDFVFENGELRPSFLKEFNRAKLAGQLRRRFILAGFTNILCAPITVLYMTLLYFFRYFNEYHRDPSSIGSRQYTPLAEWKMREFNELHHLFLKRLHQSYEPANRYVNQFPKEKTVLLSRFVVFVTGSFAAVLGIISLVDPELFLGFEITKDKTVLFYIGLFGSVLAIARSLIPEREFLFDPETNLREVAEYTHYLPDEWEGRYHTDEVKDEFATMYDLKILIILRELLSVVITPFLLWFSLPRSSEKIVDFFREFSIHVDGIGYVCSFATFDFSLNNGRKNAAKFRKAPPTINRRDADEETYEDEDDEELCNEYFSAADGKMLKSYLNFLENYGDGSNNGNATQPSNSIYLQPGGQSFMNGSNMHGGFGGRSVSNPGGSSFYWGPSAGGARAHNTFDSIHGSDMEHSVMGMFNRIQQQQKSGANSPVLSRSGITSSIMSGQTLSTAFEKNQRRQNKLNNNPSILVTTNNNNITGLKARNKYFTRFKHPISIGSDLYEDDEEDDSTETKRQSSFRRPTTDDYDGDLDNNEDEDNADNRIEDQLKDEDSGDGMAESYVLHALKPRKLYHKHSNKFPLKVASGTATVANNTTNTTISSARRHRSRLSHKDLQNQQKQGYYYEGNDTEDEDDDDMDLMDERAAAGGGTARGVLGLLNEFYNHNDVTKL